MKKTRKQKFKLKISSVTDNLEIIREFINNIAQKAGFNEGSVDQIELAVDEACTNVIKHAYKYSRDRMLDIAVSLDQEKIEISIMDKGAGFNPDNLPIPDLEKYMRNAKVGGLGIHLMRTLMDEVNFSINPGNKNQVSLVKYRTQKSA
ncbi:MAG: ATP-binding protein [Calditrichaceae bacterium]